MATPLGKDYISAMHDFAGNEIAAYIRAHVPTDKRILDVGAGWGKYRFLLPEYEMDAVEIWRPYIEANNLQAYYREIFVDNIVDLTIRKYDVIVMGDVLEHIDIEPAQRVVQKLVDNCGLLLIATPFKMVQEAVEDNEYEEHRQPDLTEDRMAERYPQLKLYKLSPSQPGEHIKSIYMYEAL